MKSVEGRDVSSNAKLWRVHAKGLCLNSFSFRSALWINDVVFYVDFDCLFVRSFVFSSHCLSVRPVDIFIGPFIFLCFVFSPCFHFCFTFHLIGFPFFPHQVNLALSIIYARHLLAAILSDWPEEQVITSELLDKCDEIQLIGLLDIIQRMESKETFENVRDYAALLVLCLL